MKKQKGKQEHKQGWITFLDVKKNIVYPVPDLLEAEGIEKARQPGWIFLGFYYGGYYAAKKYAEEVFVNARHFKK